MDGFADAGEGVFGDEVGRVYRQAAKVAKGRKDWGYAFQHMGMRHSIQPVLDAQSRHRFEVGKVSSEQGGIVRQADAGDFQILGADLLAERFQ